MKKTYRDAVIRSIKRSNLDDESKLILCAMSLNIESGEFADLIKKSIFHHQKLDRENLVKKLGDLRWYLEFASIAIGVSMDEIEKQNVLKLVSRMPEAFSEEDV